VRAEAHGEGPITFSALVTQEFQWSRSLVMVLLTTVPKHLGRMPWKLRTRFMFALSFYPLLVLTTVVGLSLPPIAAVTGLPWVNVSYFEFLLHWLLVGVWLLALTWTIRRWGLLRPTRSPILSWENWLYAVTRWPFIALGVFAAIKQGIRPGAAVTFRVTPKGASGVEPLAVRLIVPFVVISLVLSGSALFGQSQPGGRHGYIFLCLLGAFAYALAAVAVPVLHAVESARSTGLGFRAAARRTVFVPGLLGLLTTVMFAVAAAPFPAYLAPALAQLRFPF
jgi:cellulose synthase (UDP-forming)